MTRLCLFLLFSPAFFVACASFSSDGQRLNQLSAYTIDQDFFEMSDYLGKDIILMNFWATWCEPCKAEMPTLQRIHERYENKGIRVLSIAVDSPETSQDIAPYIRRQGYSFPVVYDEYGAISQRYNPSSSTPYTLIIDKKGDITKRILGFQPSESQALEDYLLSLRDAP